MDKQNLYLALINAVFGVGISMLLNGNLLIYGLAFVVILTILLIERRRIYENIFRRKLGWTLAGYATVVVAMIGVMSFVNRSNWDKASIIKTTQDFVEHLKPGEYDKAYEMLSAISKKSYPLDAFVKDNQKASIKVEDFRIDRVEFNEFDKRKAVVKVSSPFMIYGQSSMTFDSVKEDSGWKLVFTPSIVNQKGMQANQSGGVAPRPTTRRRSSGGGSIGGAFRSLF